MTRTITNEQRHNLFKVACEMENPIAQIGCFKTVMFRVAEALTDPDDGDAVRIIAMEIERRERDLTEAHEKLFHGLHEFPQRVETADADVANIRTAGAS